MIPTSTALAQGSPPQFVRPVEQVADILMRVVTAIGVWAGIAAGAQGVLAQCPLDWARGFESPGVAGGFETEVLALAVFDDGSGPALYVGGDFTVAGPALARYIAKWDGATWSAVGTALWDRVYALRVFDDGGGAALYAGGGFGIRKWDEGTWSSLGSGIAGDVYALAVFDDGTGPALYAGGEFTYAGGFTVNGIAKWDGSTWSPLGSGMYIWPPPPTVYALAVYDDGTGPALYAGGNFWEAGGVTAYGIAKWDGGAWAPVGTGVNSPVRALTVYDDGSGSALYAGGEFTVAGGLLANYIAKWDGSSWSPLGGGMGGIINPKVRVLGVYDDGTGPALYAGGYFRTAGAVTAQGLAKWDGATWSGMGEWMGWVYGLAVLDDGGAPALYVGGRFALASGVGAQCVAKWDGTTWSALGAGQGMGSRVYALSVFDDGSGGTLCAGGSFISAGGISANRIARWNGSAWSALGDGVAGAPSSVLALTVFDDGSGPALYAAGEFSTAGGVPANNIAKWDGTSWSALGAGVGGPAPEVYELGVFDDGSGPALYAAGRFTTAGVIPANNIAKWNGSDWSSLGSGVTGAQEALLNALAVFDDGSGAALYAAGYFTTAGGLPAKNIAKWDGANWSALGSGLTGAGADVIALAVFDDGTGPALYAGGTFTAAGGVSAKYIAKWDATAWSPVGGGTNGPVTALGVFDDGGGTALYASGWFTVAGGVSATGIAKWDGSRWWPLGTGMPNGYAWALSGFDDGTGPALYVGGDFVIAGGKPSAYIAKWGCVCVYGDLNCDGLIDQLDIDPFVLALVDPAGYAAAYPNCNRLCADCNQDGVLNAFDIDPFVELLTP